MLSVSSLVSLSFVVVSFPLGLGIFALSGFRRSGPPPLGALAWAPLALMLQLEGSTDAGYVALRDLPRVVLIDR